MTIIESKELLSNSWKTISATVWGISGEVKTRLHSYIRLFMPIPTSFSHTGCLDRFFLLRITETILNLAKKYLINWFRYDQSIFRTQRPELILMVQEVHSVSKISSIYRFKIKLQIIHHHRPFIRYCRFKIKGSNNYCTTCNIMSVYITRYNFPLLLLLRFTVR